MCDLGIGCEVVAAILEPIPVTLNHLFAVMAALCGCPRFPRLLAEICQQWRLPRIVQSPLLRAVTLNTAVVTIILVTARWEASMWRRFSFAVTTIIAALAIPASVLAAGAPIRKPPVTVPAMTAPSTPSAPSAPAVEQGVSHEQLFGGCGGRRVRDPRTGQCRGPADVGR
jgi:hypothetical protein